MNAKRFLGIVSTTLAASCLLVTLPAAYAQSDLPDSIKVPDGHKVALETVGVGEITYECRSKTNATGQTEWAFVGPKAVLNDRSGKQVGTYFGPPATWQANDGSKNYRDPTGSCPLRYWRPPLSVGQGYPCGRQWRDERCQLYPTGGRKRRRSATTECSTADKGKREVVKYQADYIFWATN